MPMPFQPIEPSKRKVKEFRFRVSKEQEELLLNIGSPVRWRDFCLTVAQVITTLQSGVMKNHENDEPVTIDQVSLARVIRQIFEEGISMEGIRFEDDKEPT